MKTTHDVTDYYQHYLDLRKSYPEFIYNGCQISASEQEIELVYNFEIKNLACFKPSWKFPVTNHNITKTTAFHNAVFYLGMVELISYWKLTCSPKVKIKERTLDSYEINWWKKLYFNGLGEFYYRNNILQNDNKLTADTMMNIICENNPPTDTDTTEFDNSKLNGCLIPIGGGKDSAVSLELLRELNLNNSCYIINPRGATLDTAQVYGFKAPDIYKATRTLCPKMLELNKEGFLNGHTPFSAIVAFSSTLSAMLCGKKYIVLSNEDSANESTVAGTHVNHQYSKSYEFEKDFVKYEQKYIGSKTFYFSLLRPLCELQIAKLFTEKCRDYFPIFKSCNVGSKENIWCTSCSKCLFVYLILSPFIEEKDLVKIFGKKLTDDKTLLEDFARLIGLTKEKPFECVGSVDEVNTAIHISIETLLKQGKSLPLLYRYYMEQGLFQPSYNKELHLKHFNQENGLPKEFINLILKHI